MDLVELRLLAAGGILTLGIVMSLLGWAATVAIERIQKASRIRGARASSAPAVGPRPHLGTGRVRC
jgi:hypothetical protein